MNTMQMEIYYSTPEVEQGWVQHGAFRCVVVLRKKPDVTY